MKYFLGIDTSNYTTSVALIEMPENQSFSCSKQGEKNSDFLDINDNGHTEKGDKTLCLNSAKIIFNSRKLLDVKNGERGLRQSDALYQHWNNLPVLLEPILKEYRDRISGIVVSEKPRSVENSYMPVFNAGLSVAYVLQFSIPCKLIKTSHQDGHFVSAAYGTTLNLNKPILFFHLSGGTLEAVLFDKTKRNLVASTKDISFGQLLDRAAVAMGYPFPGGKYINELATRYFSDYKGNCLDAQSIKELLRGNSLSKISIRDNQLNLSGIETQVLNKINSIKNSDERKVKNDSKIDQFSVLSFDLMLRIAEAIASLIFQCREKISKDENFDDNTPVLMAGGVSSSTFLRELLIRDVNNIHFGNADFCTDNAIGCALIGGMQ